MAVRSAPHSLNYLADLGQAQHDDVVKDSLKLKRSAVAIAPDCTPRGYVWGAGWLKSAEYIGKFNALVAAI